ncbi:hypothetical protein evm_002241 [Chilo suppressalis]|nr:hypothetical protein evm_002241 [Chilo suppressalis]
MAIIPQMNKGINTTVPSHGDPAIPAHGGGPGNGGVRGAKNLRSRSGHQIKQTLGLVTHNIRTLRTHERIAELEDDLSKIRWDIGGLSEVRRQGEDTITLRSGNLLYHREGDDLSQGGVGFIVPKLSFVYAMVALSMAASLKSENNKPKAGVNPNKVHCDPEGQIFLLLPDTSDCTIFFMCTHGKEVQFSCPPQTIFDFELQGCDWKDSGTCILRDQQDVEGSGDEDEEASGFWQPEESESYALESASDAELKASFAGILDCRKPEDASRQAPYKGDCQRYWKCVNGAVQSAYCTDGLFFNAQTQQCDFEANAKCIVQTENNELEGEFIVYK